MSKQESDFEGYLNTAEAKEFFSRAEREMFPKMQGSAVNLTLLTDSNPDAKLCIEVGASILFNKPIIVLAIKGAKVPAGLVRVAHSVIHVDDLGDPDSKQKIMSAIQKAIGSAEVDLMSWEDDTSKTV